MAWSRAGSPPTSSRVSSDAEFRAGPKPYRLADPSLTCGHHSLTPIGPN